MCPLASVYFPEEGLAGLYAETGAGETAQCASVGYEGAVGCFEACGSRRAFYRAVVQLPGMFWKLRASTYRELYSASFNLRTANHKLVELQLSEARQYVACNALHTLPSRVGRLLLEIEEKALCGPVISVTQDALAQMLGVQRSSATLAIASLEKVGALVRGRGALRILDRAALEREACSCRATLLIAKEEIRASTLDVCEA